MKIRIRGNSIRIRLSKSEVAKFADQGYIEETTDFGSSKLTYAVRSTEEETMSADFTGEKVTMFVPEDLLKPWATTNLVGLEHNMPLKENNQLYILLEKDFKCIDAVTTEDQSDYFENPLETC